MKMLLVTLALLLFAACASKSQLRNDASLKVRKYDKSKTVRYHQPLELKIGWFPYHDETVERKEENVWTVVKEADAQEPMHQYTDGAMPMIIINYPDSTQNITLEMNIDDALLGRLLKHSLMTEIPIEMPLKQYMEKADCATCHPADVKIRRSPLDAPKQ